MSRSALNEGREVNPDDTWPFEDTADPYRSPLNEGREVNPDDTRLAQLPLQGAVARSTKVGRLIPTTQLFSNNIRLTGNKWRLALGESVGKAQKRDSSADPEAQAFRSMAASRIAARNWRVWGHDR